MSSKGNDAAVLADEIKRFQDQLAASGDVSEVRVLAGFVHRLAELVRDTSDADG